MCLAVAHVLVGHPVGDHCLDRILDTGRTDPGHRHAGAMDLARVRIDLVSLPRNQGMAEAQRSETGGVNCAEYDYVDPALVSLSYRKG